MATIADLATLAATGVASGDYLVISDSGVDKKIDATLVPWTSTISYFARQVSLNLPNNSGEAGFNVEVTTGVASNQRAAFLGRSSALIAPVMKALLRAQASSSAMGVVESPLSLPTDEMPVPSAVSAVRRMSLVLRPVVDRKW